MPEFDLHNKRNILIGENRGRKVLHCANKDSFIVKEMHHGFWRVVLCGRDNLITLCANSSLIYNLYKNMILSSGQKNYWSAGRLGGCFWSVGGSSEELDTENYCSCHLYIRKMRINCYYLEG